MNAPLAVTPLHSWHKKNGGKLVEFAGFDMPVQYEGIVAEHTATRTAAGLFDISHMGRLRFDGREQTNCWITSSHDAYGHASREVRYSLMCNEEGAYWTMCSSVAWRVLAESFTFTRGQRGNHAKIKSWIQPHLADFPDVEFSDSSSTTAMIAVQGPKAVEIARGCFSVRSMRWVIIEPRSLTKWVNHASFHGPDTWAKMGSS